MLGGHITKIKLILILLLAGFFSVLFIDFSDPRLPAAPDSVSAPGRYMLDDKRFVEVRQEGTAFKYYEGRLDSAPTGSRAISGSNHERILVDSVQLGDSWSLSFESPETVVITSADGTTRHRRYGTTDSAPKKHSLIRKSPKALPIPSN